TDPIKNKKELGEQALVYAKEEDNLDRIEKKVNQLLKIVNDQKVFRNKLKLLEYQSTKLKHAEDIDKLIIQMETNKQKIPPLSSTLIRIIEKKILDIIESIQKSRGLTPDLISYNYVPLLLDHENIFKHLENKIKNWTKCNKLSLELFKDIFNKLLHIIRIKNEEKKKSQLIFEGQKFPLFAIDVNNLMYSLRDKFPDKYKNKTIKYPLYLINELYLEKTPYLAYFFVSNHLKKYLNDVPKNEYNKHYVETLRKNYSSGEYVDVDVMLASKITSVLDKYNNQINHFYLGSGDKDFHPIIKKAQKYKIPVSIIVSDGSSISNEISQLVNYQVDILY
ncbi:MAG: NYN domain-containing protein, partial [Candidatus Thorarchaeota archaeon]